MKRHAEEGISFFQRYLTAWVLLCMAAGVLLGHFVPVLPAALDRVTYARISLPMAVLIWIMIYPMMIKVDFQSIREVGRHPKGLFVTWITNWLIKPFTMYALAAFFFFHVFQAF
ncbi:arsenic resistance protein, partial [Evtepia sp.]|uniref:arsenic resistance protein n=1 Tax=Evtepia sp. TaxID=2773933 RepID=UPI002A8F56EA|nr:arsenical-resistance protein [Evtepia sp.]